MKDDSMRKCAFCGKELPDDGEEHHLIPKFLGQIGLTDANLDNYRIILCKDKHEEITNIWKGIFRKLKLIW